MTDKELENTSSWIERMRKMQNTNMEKFSLVDNNQILKTNEQHHKTDGLLIGHKLDEFESNIENEETILVLKDSSIYYKINIKIKIFLIMMMIY